MADIDKDKDGAELEGESKTPKGSKKSSEKSADKDAANSSRPNVSDLIRSAGAALGGLLFDDEPAKETTKSEDQSTEASDAATERQAAEAAPLKADATPGEEPAESVAPKKKKSKKKKNEPAQDPAEEISWTPETSNLDFVEAASTESLGESSEKTSDDESSGLSAFEELARRVAATVSKKQSSQEEPVEASQLSEDVAEASAAASASAETEAPSVDAEASEQLMADQAEVAEPAAEAASDEEAISAKAKGKSKAKKSKKKKADEKAEDEAELHAEAPAPEAVEEAYQAQEVAEDHQIEEQALGHVIDEERVSVNQEIDQTLLANDQPEAISTADTVLGDEPAREMTQMEMGETASAEGGTSQAEMGQTEMSAMGEELDAAENDADPEPTEFIEASQLISIIESLLFSTDKPVSVATIKQIFKGTNVRTKDIMRALDSLASEFAGATRGVSLEEVHGGYQLRTKSDNMDFLRRLAKVRPFRLSGPALEVMAIVAYKQPITKHEIDEIRGVESGHLLRALMERGLVSFEGKSDLPGKPMAYGSTRKFLEIFGLRNLKELPTLSEIDELIPEGIGEVEEKETLSDITDSMAQQIAGTYSEGEDELSKINEQLSAVDTTTEFFEQEKQRERERRDRERAQDIRERVVLGELVEEKDRRWLDRYDAKMAMPADQQLAADGAEAAAPAGDGESATEPGPELSEQLEALTEEAQVAANAPTSNEDGEDEGSADDLAWTENDDAGDDLIGNEDWNEEDEK